jgi:hypothetical protein
LVIFMAFSFRRVLVSAALVATFAASAPLAQTQTTTGQAPATPATATGQTTKTAQNSYDPNEMVCKRIEETGTRLGGEKVCMTRFEWDEKSREARDQLDFSDRQTDQRGWGH